MLEKLGFKIFSDNENLYLQFDEKPVVKWYEGITTIVGQNQKGCILGVEILVYEDAEIDFEKLRKQFRRNATVNTEEFGLFYLAFPNSDRKPSSGFGRGGNVGFNDEGLLSMIVIPWNAPGAGTPYVDSSLALQDYEFTQTSPPTFRKHS